MEALDFRIADEDLTEEIISREDLVRHFAFVEGDIDVTELADALRGRHFATRSAEGEAELVLSQWLEAATSLEPRPAEWEVGFERLAYRATVPLAVALGLLIAVLALLFGGIYPDSGDAFGTRKNYISAFVAGATGSAVVQFIQSPLTSLLARDRSKKE